MQNKTFLQNAKYYYLGIRGITPIVASSPLYIALLVAIFSGKEKNLFCSAIALACFTTASIITKKFFTALRAQMFLAQHKKKEIRDTRPLALIINTLGVAALAYLTLKNIRIVGFVSIIGALGFYLNYMLIPVNEDLEPEKAPQSTNLPATLQKMVNDAYTTLNQLKEHTKVIGQSDNNLKIALQLQSIIQKAQFIVNKSINDPGRIRSMRSFFIVHLPELNSICENYIKLTPQYQSAEQQKELSTLLKHVDSSFSSHQITLTNEEERALHVKMTVLKQQIQTNIKE